MISTFDKDYLEKLIAILGLFDFASFMAKLIVKLLAKWQQKYPEKDAKKCAK